MTIYGYVRTSKAQEPGHAGSDPEVQRRQLLDSGVEPRHIFSDVGISGANGISTRNQWHALDQKLGQGDVLMVAAIDRISRRYLDTMWSVYDLQRRGIRIRSLAENEGQWTAYLDADPDSAEAFIGHLLASMAAYVASQERQAISRRTRAGLEKARANGKQLGRPKRLTDEQLATMRQDHTEGKSLMAISRDYGIPEPTVRRHVVSKTNHSQGSA